MSSLSPAGLPPFIVLLQIWVAAVDPLLTKNGLISPGLGDTVSESHVSPRRSSIEAIRVQGDRLYNTLKD